MKIFLLSRYVLCSVQSRWQPMISWKCNISLIQFVKEMYNQRFAKFTLLLTNARILHRLIILLTSVMKIFGGSTAAIHYRGFVSNLITIVSNCRQLPVMADYRKFIFNHYNFFLNFHYYGLIYPGSTVRLFMLLFVLSLVFQFFLWFI